MILLVAKSASQLPDHPRIGTLVTPSNGAVPGSRPWAADNEAYVGFDRARFTAMVERIRQYPDCLFVAAPDVVGDHQATRRRWDRWAGAIWNVGLPAAFVAQDGCQPDDVPPEAAAVFIGGTTEWKLGPARAVVEAHAGRRWVHVGRVNTRRRLRLVKAWGADSADGTSMARFPDSRLPTLLKEIDHQQLPLPYT